MELTMGRIVYYTPSDPNDVTAVQAPAIVSRVKDGLACLTVFPPENTPYSVTGVAEAQSGGSELGTWCWPVAAPTGSQPEGAGGGDTTDTPTPGDGDGSAEGEGGASAGEGDQGGGEVPSTSEASEKPLYAIAEGASVPDGFGASGLETPEGATLYHFEGDTAGQPHTFDVGSVEGVGLYAEADDNAQPVKPAEPATA